MKYSIFHTSHCGSTLIATLLKDSIETFCEPSWTGFQDCRYLMSHEDNKLVKYPSYASMASRVLKGKKVFLYRKLKDHLEKISRNKKFVDTNVNIYYPFCKKRNIFSNLNADSDLKKLAVVWLHRYLDAYYSQDVLFIDANNFFLDPKKTVKQITDFFEIKPIKNFEYLNFYVKNDFNIKDQALSSITPKSQDQIPYDFKSGYIRTEKFSDIEDWINEHFINKIKPNQIYPLLRNKENKPIYYFLPGVTIHSNLEIKVR